MSQNQPQLSADGRFYWDGQAWKPMPGIGKSVSPARTAGIVVVVGAALAAVGTLLPYAEATGPFGISLSRAGVQTDGLLVLIASVFPAAVAGIVFLRRAPGNASLVLSFVSALAVLGTLIYVWYEIARSGAAFPDLDIQTGPGVYVSAVGAIVAIVGSFMASQSTSSERTYQPPPAATQSWCHMTDPELGVALARTVSALEQVRLDALEPKDRDLVVKALTDARAALAEYRRATRPPEPFPQEDWLSRSTSRVGIIRV
jgi:hypothetical protein